MPPHLFESEKSRLFTFLGDTHNSDSALHWENGGHSMAKPLILVVDDSAMLRELAERGLLEFEVEVHTAENGLEAVEAATSNQYDLILMDILMPEMDGFEATRQIRAAGLDLTIIGVTAVGDYRECLAAGMNDYSTKPADYRKIIKRWFPDCARRVEKAASFQQAETFGEIELPDGRKISKESPTQVLIDLAKGFDEGKIDLSVRQVETLCQWLLRRPPERDFLIEQWLKESR